MGPRIAGDGDGVNVARGNTGNFQAGTDRQRREAGHMLDAGKTLFLGRGEELSIPEERGGGFRVVGVDPKDYDRLLRTKRSSQACARDGLRILSQPGRSAKR